MIENSAPHSGFAMSQLLFVWLDCHGGQARSRPHRVVSFIPFL
jgi:hypothetical protein